MTGDELLNLLAQEFEESGLLDSEVVLNDVLCILSQLDVPKAYWAYYDPPEEAVRNQ